VCQQWPRRRRSPLFDPGRYQPDTQTARPIDFDNAMYYTWDTNGRMFWGDVQRALLIDRPTRLSPTPSPF
jgi:hypothetical protein